MPTWRKIMASKLEVRDCALTERARKKLERQGRRKRGKGEESLAEEAEESKKVRRLR